VKTDGQKAHNRTEFKGDEAFEPGVLGFVHHAPHAGSIYCIFFIEGRDAAFAELV